MRWAGRGVLVAVSLIPVCLAFVAALSTEQSSRAVAAGLVTTTTVPRPVGAGAVDLCGDPTDDGQITATDSLLILRVSVGLETCPRPCICDVDGNGSITATDALIVLRRSVDPSIVLDCSTCLSTTTFTLPPTTLTTVTTTSTSTTTTIDGFRLQVDLLGTGGGTVTDNRDGIDCGIDCAETYASGTSVTLTAAANGCTDSVGGSSFVAWSGDTPAGACTGTGTCTFTMTQDRLIDATFDVVCPKNAPITNLQLDCADHGYFYRLGSLAEGLATDGEDIELVQTNGSVIITYDGTVESATTFDLTSANFGSGSQDLANGSGGSISTNGRSLDFTVVIPSGGGTFDFEDHVWFDEVCITPSSLISRPAESADMKPDQPSFVRLLEALRR